MSTQYNEAWLLFNETVRNKSDDYGPFTNAHWQAVNVIHEDNQQLLAALADMVAVYPDDTEDDFPALARARECLNRHFNTEKKA